MPATVHRWGERQVYFSNVFPKQDEQVHRGSDLWDRSFQQSESGLRCPHRKRRTMCWS